MASRKKIVFPYYNSYFTSTAIIIYQTNVLKSLNLLPDQQKPHIYIWHNHQSPLEEIKKIQYPYICFINIKSVPFRLKKLLSVIVDKLGLSAKILFNTQFDAVFPAYQDSFLLGIKKRLYWKADFQENYFPDYFLEKELVWVKQFFKHLSQDKNGILVLSSYDAYHDFKTFYPEVQNEVQLFRFVSHLQYDESFDLDKTLQKFNIRTKKYFIVCNQYWPHKNHIVILKAIGALKEKTPELGFQVVFTGKTSSVRGSKYFDELNNFITDHNLTGDIVITGFLDREEQVGLMKHSIAIIQPTLFEGWSTVIEDGKALNKYIVASDINVNKEQVSDNVRFFNPHDPVSLGNILEQLTVQPIKEKQVDYAVNITSSVNDLKNIFGL